MHADTCAGEGQALNLCNVVDAPFLTCLNQCRTTPTADAAAGALMEMGQARRTSRASTEMTKAKSWCRSVNTAAQRVRAIVVSVRKDFHTWLQQLLNTGGSFFRDALLGSAAATASSEAQRAERRRVTTEVRQLHPHPDCLLPVSLSLCLASAVSPSLVSLCVSHAHSVLCALRACFSPYCSPHSLPVPSRRSMRS